MLDANVRKRYEAFWACEAHGRCCLFLTVPRYTEAPPEPTDPAARWEDIDGRLGWEEFVLDSTEYLADAFRTVFVNFGPGCLTACIGGTQKWALNTVWFENDPVIADWEHPPVPALNRESLMYRLVERFTETSLQRGAGRFYTSITDIGGTYDIIAAMRGTENLLTDLYDYPGEVKAFADAIYPIWRDYFLAQSARLIARQGAMTSWMPIYSEKAYFPLQCDFSAMLSPRMFEEFVLPDLERQTRMMDRSIYHLDGPGEIPHLDMLLSMERLSAIQWVPGAGAADTTDPCWYELYARIQRAGKGLILLEADPDGIESLLRHVSAKGLFIRTDTQDMKQAREIAALADALGRS